MKCINNKGIEIINAYEMNSEEICMHRESHVDPDERRENFVGFTCSCY